MGHHTTLYCEGLKCQQKFAQSCLQEGELSAKIDDVPSQIISLNFYRGILESSPQTRFMFDVKKLLLIDALTFIPRETQDDPLRIAICLDSVEFPKQVILLITGKQKVQV